MANLPTVDDVRVRTKIRDALQAAGGYGRTVQELLEDVNFLFGAKPGAEPVNEHQLSRCIEHQLSRQFIRTAWDDDKDADCWYLTPHGHAKQNESIR